jgi:IS605 OrfB family transposase
MKRKKKSIKSTHCSLKFVNKGKLDQLGKFINEYRQVTEKFIDLLWPYEEMPKRLGKEFTDQIKGTWLSARAVQAAGSQASGIVRGTKEKQRKREFIYEKLLAEGKFKKARKLKIIMDKAKMSKPSIKNLEPALDQRFIHQDWKPSTKSFDAVLTLVSLGFSRGSGISLPVKKTKHFNELSGHGSILSGIKISKQTVTFCFNTPRPPLKEVGNTVGLDVGIKNCFTLSTGVASQVDRHGHTLDTILDKLSRKKNGSKAFKQAQQHRTNYINWSMNQIRFEGMSKLRVEAIKEMRKGHRTSRKLNRFTYTEMFSKLESLCATNGVQIEHVSPTYTSQRCSKCGWVRNTNRNGKLFKCGSCGFTTDADLNAAINISVDLRPIGREERRLRPNRKGFYWNEVGGKPIVSLTSNLKQKSMF